MRRLLLLRHAEAVLDAPGGTDRDRALTDAGRSAAEGVARTLIREGWRPTRVLCSSARRAVETFEPIGQHATDAPPMIEDDLYLASRSHLVERIRRLDPLVPDDGCVLVVGHNPGIAELAAWLDPDARGLGGFPPAALAVLALRVEAWDDLARGAAELEALRLPDGT